jgi:hypothetical protein
MSGTKPRRFSGPEAPEQPSGYRQTRRGSKAAKSAAKAEKRYQTAAVVARTSKGARNALIVAVQTLAGIAFVVLCLLVIATAINGYARWNAKRMADKAASPAEAQRRERENILVIAAQGDTATGYLAMRVNEKDKLVFGIAIPDGAFLDVPGQGFERVGEAYKGGPDVALSAVSNFLTVPFRTYLVVPTAVYQDALTKQDVSQLVARTTRSNLSADGLAALDRALKSVPQKNVAMVPMPVKPIKLGQQTYFEPQRAKVADLLKSWWGISAARSQRATRIIVYNGSGTPGIAGDAAQKLIRSGFRVVDTKNADNFKYAKTQVVVRRGVQARGAAVAKALGVGEVLLDPSDEDVTDVIVIIGKDYKPTKSSGGN